uniref:Polygalacturonase n=1 Tax=Cajanus cajan TaxID=3821 RepID=A0A151U6B5_CAJCA|nr:putative polygalacturonase [Cajanus cajan]
MFSTMVSFFNVVYFVQVIGVISLVLTLGSLNVKVAECRVASGPGNIEYPAINCRKHSAVLTDFGGVGDGKTSNTKAFQSAISKLSQYASDGGSQLVVPPGKWLTGPFNLTSHFTLFLHKDAVLLASQDESEWTQIPVLPSYGRGNDAPDRRSISLIFGTNLTDVVITGQNGTIDGQGSYWWDKLHKNELKVTRPVLIEIMYSDQIQISHLTLVNSPNWFVHPIYSSNIIIQWLTILAPVKSPNTDGIDPDSCTNVRIEDCYIVSGDDCIAVKSGLDEYGIKVGKPTQHLIIRRLKCRVASGPGNIEYPAINCRKHSAVLTDFGGVGDGKTSNTKAFQSAISKLSQYASDGGSQLVVPPGKWLTGPFNLTSHFTLFLHKDAVLLASQVESEWPQLPVLPSYGRGRDAPGGRFSSLIFGTNLTDVVITGQNGTIDGQGSYWWDKFHKNQLTLTRPYMIEIMYSDQIQISNLTLVNSPSWFVHPIYSSNIIIQGLTILAPVDSPNTDGIDPDSCTNTRIEDCFIVSGDDCISAKSGWDEYGIKFGRPTQDVIAKNVTYSAKLEGISNDPFTGICVSNVTIQVSEQKKKLQWNCTNVAGVASNVTPVSCPLLPEKGKFDCPFPNDKLPIENVQLKTCSSV